MFEPKEYKITSIKQFAEDIKLIRIETRMNPLPGQFFQLSVLGIGECPLASCSYNKNYVDILVRNVGTVTSALFRKRKGDKIMLRGPYGKGFPVKEMKRKNLILVAGGTGIAPITSLIEYVEKNRRNFGDVSIYFGFRSKNYVLLEDRIRRWKKKFDVILTLDKQEEGWRGEAGFLHDVIARKKPGIENSLAFLCGPEIMMKAVTEKLNSQGFENNKIFWSMERRMECAIGNCGRCLIQDVYVCRDGPVFRYDEIKPKLENEESSKI